MAIDLRGPVKGKDVRIAFPEATEERILRAARFLADHKLCKPVLVGSYEKVVSSARDFGVSVDGIEIIPLEPGRLESFAQQLVELRKNKGLSLEESRQLLSMSMYYATMLLLNGEVDGVVAGATQPTSSTLRPALQIIRTKPDTPLASSFFIMETGRGTFFFADCALNIELSEEGLALVGVQTALSARSFGVEPRVAFLSFSSKGSGSHESAEKVSRAAKIASKMLPGVAVDGELQVDAALDEVVGRLKAPDSPVAGHANVLIFPSLESGNIGYKLVQRFSGAKAIGPVVQGLRKPVNDLSRGCSVEEVVEVACVTAIQALRV